MERNVDERPEGVSGFDVEEKSKARAGPRAILYSSQALKYVSHHHLHRDGHHGLDQV
jgi:hypothetical protein